MSSCRPALCMAVYARHRLCMQATTMCMVAHAGMWMAASPARAPPPCWAHSLHPGHPASLIRAAELFPGPAAGMQPSRHTTASQARRQLSSPAGGCRTQCRRLASGATHSCWWWSPGELCRRVLCRTLPVHPTARLRSCNSLRTAGNAHWQERPVAYKAPGCLATRFLLSCLQGLGQ